MTIGKAGAAASADDYRAATEQSGLGGPGISSGSDSGGDSLGGSFDAGSARKKPRRLRRMLVAFTAVSLAALLGISGVAIAQTDSDSDSTEKAEAEKADGERRFGKRFELGTTVGEALGIDAEAVETALKSGTTLAELATQNGSNAAELIDELVARAASKAAEHGVEFDTDDRTWLEEKLNEIVDVDLNELANRYRDSFRAGRGSFKFGHSEVLTDLLGITAEEIWTALWGGSTLAELAEANGVAAAEVVDALVAETEARITEWAAAFGKEVDAAMLTAMLAELRDQITAGVNGELEERSFGRGFGRRGWWGHGAGADRSAGV